MVILVNFDLNKSLDELEGLSFNESEVQSNLIIKCQSLRKMKLKDYTIEDLRLMIGQQIGLEYLVPLALETLAINPFVEGDLYNGDIDVDFQLTGTRGNDVERCGVFFLFY